MAVKLGGGAAIKIKDASVLCSKVVIDGLTALAEEDKIPYQYEVLVAGGTDTSSMQTAGAGSFAGAISIRRATSIRRSRWSTTRTWKPASAC